MVNCPCHLKGKNYKLVVCNDCKKNLEEMGFVLEELK